MSSRSVSTVRRHGEPPPPWARLGTRDPLVEMSGASDIATVLRVQLPSTSDSTSVARSLVCVLLDDRGVVGDSRADVVLAVSEAASNAIEYGEGPHIDVCIELDDGACLVSVGNRISQVPPRFSQELADTRMPGSAAPRGRGVAIMDVVMDRIAVDIAGGRCVVEMFRRIDR